MKKIKGFTLVELMVVIVIIGILAALAIPRFLGATNKTKASEFKPVVKQLYTLQLAYRQEHDGYIASGSETLLGFENPGINARFDYSANDPGSSASGANAILAKAAPNANGQKIKRPSGTALLSTDIGCIDADGTLRAQANLNELASTGNALGCP